MTAHYFEGPRPHYMILGVSWERRLHRLLLGSHNFMVIALGCVCEVALRWQ